jgi:2-desacetyl-2-hydroxyethyl bacteriochlorophyllide A dehydrogenase
LIVRAAIYQGPKQIEIREVQMPELGHSDVLVEVEACGVCGSDIGSYNFGHYVEPGQIMGHEISAHVVAVGNKIRDLEVGNQVAIRPMRTCGECGYCTSGHSNLCGATVGRSLGYGLRGGFAEQILLSDVVVGADVIAIVDALPATELLWAEPLAVAVHAVGLLSPSTGDSLLVLGAGSVGLCVVAVALAAGVADIVVVEPREQRRNAVASMGVRAVNPGEIGSDELFTGAVDTSGVSQVISDAVGRLRLGSRLVLLGLGEGPVVWPVRGAQLTGSFAYTDSDFRVAVDHIVSGRIRLGRFVTHQFSLGETADAMVASTVDPSLVKAAIVPRMSNVNS